MVGISIVLMIMVEEQTCLGIISSEKCYQSSKHGQCITVNGADFFPHATLTFI